MWPTEWSATKRVCFLTFDAMYRETLRALHWRSSDTTRSRLGGRMMGAPQETWEDRVQKVCNMRLAGARGTNRTDVGAAMSVRRASEVPQGRWMIRDTPPS